jgi:NADH-quinone oxidoreductase subunit G
VIAVESQLTDTVVEFADVVFPAEAYPEKEGTLTHPDGRVQRLRQAIGHPRGPGAQPGSGVRALWQVISDVARAVGFDEGTAFVGSQVSQRLFEAVPFYNGLTLDAIGGRGVRWQDEGAFDVPAAEPTALDVPAGLPAKSDAELRLGTYRPLWAAKEVDIAPALQFIRAKQVVELSPADAGARGINEGDRVEVGNGTRIPATVRLRASIPTGSVFLAEGIAEHNSNVLTHGIVEVRRVGPGTTEPSSIPIQSQPAVEGLAEMPPSAGLPIPPREVT